MIITAASCNYSDVTGAVALASTGDIVQLPNGLGSWNNIVYVQTPNVTVRGMGTGNTVIQLVSGVTPNAFAINQNVTIRDMSIYNCPTVALIHVFGGTGGWRVTNINYSGDGQNTPYFVECDVAGAYGLVDNCTINTAIPQFGNGSAELIYVRGPTNAWQTPSVCGTAANLFVENCNFHGRGYVCDANANAQVVVRFCNIYDASKVDGHGVDSNSPPRSVRTLETYNNNWYTTFTNNEGITIRGGAGYAFNNTCVNQDGTQLLFQLYDYGCATPWPFYGTTITGFTLSGATGICYTAAPHLVSGSWTVYVYQNLGFLPLFNVAPSPDLSPNVLYTTGLDQTFAPTGVTGLHVVMIQTPVNWPTTDQIGVGQDPKQGGSQPYYFWNNKAATTTPGSPTGQWPLTWPAIDANGIKLYRQQTSNPSATYTMRTMISGGRDYFIQTVGSAFQGTGDVGYGTVAQMKAAATPSQSGVGWWATDTGTWWGGTGGGVLFTWNGSVWTPLYTPYTYPHPLTVPQPVVRQRVGHLGRCSVVVL